MQYPHLFQFSSIHTLIIYCQIVIKYITCIRLLSCTSVSITSISWTKPIPNLFRDAHLKVISTYNTEVCCFTPIYSAYRKSSYNPFIPHFFILLCCIIMLNCLNFSNKIYTPLTIMTKKKPDLSQLCTFIKKETLKKKWHCTSLHTLHFDTWNLDQVHFSFTGTSLRCFYTPTS